MTVKLFLAGIDVGGPRIEEDHPGGTVRILLNDRGDWLTVENRQDCSALMRAAVDADSVFIRQQAAAEAREVVAAELAPVEVPEGKCSEHDCDESAEDLRWDHDRGWLPVCMDHADPDDLPGPGRYKARDPESREPLPPPNDGTDIPKYGPGTAWGRVLDAKKPYDPDDPAPLADMSEAEVAEFRDDLPPLPQRIPGGPPVVGVSTWQTAMNDELSPEALAGSQPLAALAPDPAPEPQEEAPDA